MSVSRPECIACVKQYCNEEAGSLLCLKMTVNMNCIGSYACFICLFTRSLNWHESHCLDNSRASLSFSSNESEKCAGVKSGSATQMSHTAQCGNG